MSVERERLEGERRERERLESVCVNVCLVYCCRAIEGVVAETLSAFGAPPVSRASGAGGDGVIHSQEYKALIHLPEGRATQAHRDTTELGFVRNVPRATASRCSRRKEV